MKKHNYNAYLLYKDNKGKDHYYYLWVMGYDQPFQLAGTEEQSRNYQHFYAKSYAPGDMTVEGRTPYQTQYNSLAEYLRGFHNNIINSSPSSNARGDFIPMMQLVIPDEGISVRGIIKSFSGGAKRFNVAPPFTFDFMVVKNEFQRSISFIPSHILRGTWSGAYVSSAPEIKKTKNHKPGPKRINIHFGGPPT